MPNPADEFANVVYVALGANTMTTSCISDPEAVDRYREIAGLACRGTYFLQIAEVLKPDGRRVTEEAIPCGLKC
ncbi:hypothetical protein [Actinoplanes sp. ATCC 53533]|uniref:hypothetical protein n=1 Tax=Actinoplanes sp. ATCC 53533 TaxID=1288362 RepID=UPI000F7A7153|nr:hypothetical protein [Actinoplanes sp. ATCC 53533]